MKLAKLLISEVDASNKDANDNGDEYHVKIDKLESSNENVEDEEVEDLRRSDRLTTPSSCLLSPFVVLNKVAVNRKQKQGRQVSQEDKLKEIEDWAKRELDAVTKDDSRLRKLGLTIGTPVGPDFWLSLLGVHGCGWLDDDHIYACMIDLYNSRQNTDRWCILPPHFQWALLNSRRKNKYTYYFDGSLKPLPKIKQVDEVYIPLNVKNKH